MHTESGGVDWYEGLSQAEWTRLVHLCVHLTGQSEAAEDLAQETLYEACRNARKLDDPANRGRWLAAIARNVCLRWARRTGQEQARSALRVHDARDGMPAGEDLADDIDIEVDLERSELADLLDRALAILPPTTRAVLVERYIRGSPFAEIAARLGLSEAVIAKRLERGKLTLRRLLTTTLAEEALAHGLMTADATAGWRETRIWCSGCGRARLLLRLARPPGTISFRCPVCSPAPDMSLADYQLANSYFARLIGGLTQPSALLRRTAQWSHAYFRRAIDDGAAPCTHCARPARLHISCPADRVMFPGGVPWLVVACDACDHVVSSSLGGLVTSLPKVQRFWREHRRIRTLSWRTVEADGRPAVVASLESVTSAARLDIISARDTLRVIGIHGARAAEPGR